MMRLQLVTMTGVKLDESIYSATIPTVDGEISVFPSHESIVTVARNGVITVKFKENDPESKREYFAISGGIVHIDQTQIRILVDEADHGDDIIEAETQAALDRALKQRDEAGDQIEREKAHQLVDRHMVRLRVAELQRRKGRK